MGFPKQEYRSGLPFPSPENLPDPGIKPAPLALAGRFFKAEPPGKSYDVVTRCDSVLKECLNWWITSLSVFFVFFFFVFFFYFFPLYNTFLKLLCFKILSVKWLVDQKWLEITCPFKMKNTLGGENLTHFKRKGIIKRWILGMSVPCPFELLPLVYREPIKDSVIKPVRCSSFQFSSSLIHI